MTRFIIPRRVVPVLAALALLAGLGLQEASPAGAASTDESAVAYTTTSVTATLKDPDTRQTIAVVETKVGKKDAKGLADTDQTIYDGNGKQLKVEKFKTEKGKTSSPAVEDIMALVKGGAAAPAVASARVGAASADVSRTTTQPNRASGYSFGCCADHGE